MKLNHKQEYNQNTIINDRTYKEKENIVIHDGWSRVLTKVLKR